MSQMHETDADSGICNIYEQKIIRAILVHLDIFYTSEYLFDILIRESVILFTIDTQVANICIDHV